MATSPLPRITARVDSEIQDLLSHATALAGMSSINSFVLSAAVEKAKQIIAQDQVLKLSQHDAMLLIEALDQPPRVHDKLQTAASRYDTQTQQ